MPTLEELLTAIATLRARLPELVGADRWPEFERRLDAYLADLRDERQQPAIVKAFILRLFADTRPAHIALLDIIDHEQINKRAEALRHGFKIPDSKRVVGLFPGSRRAEVTRLMPRMLDAARVITERRDDVLFLVGCSPWFNPERYKKAIAEHEDLPLRAIHGRSYEVMALSDFSMICSGTATVEAAVVGTPFLCTYRMAWASALLAQLMVNYEHACMVNILAGKQVIPELLQHQAEPLTMGLIALESMETGAPQMRQELAEVVETLGGKGASRRAAEQALSVAGLRPVSRPISTELPAVLSK